MDERGKDWNHKFQRNSTNCHRLSLTQGHAKFLDLEKKSERHKEKEGVGEMQIRAGSALGDSGSPYLSSASVSGEERRKWGWGIRIAASSNSLRDHLGNAHGLSLSNEGTGLLSLFEESYGTPVSFLDTTSSVRGLIFLQCDGQAAHRTWRQENTELCAFNAASSSELGQTEPSNSKSRNRPSKV